LMSLDNLNFLPETIDCEGVPFYFHFEMGASINGA